MVVNHLDVAVVFFDQRRAGLHPIAAVVIGHRTHWPDSRAVNVSAQNSVDRIFRRIANHFFFVTSDETDGIFDPFLGVSAQRPVTQAETAPEEIDRRIQREQKLVAHVPDEGEPLYILHDGVQFVSVNDENPPSIGGFMDGVVLDADVAVEAFELADHFVVVAGDIDHPRALARLAQDFLDDIVMLLRPVNRAAQLPDIDQIADDVERFEFVVAEKIEKHGGIGATRAQVDVRDPCGPRPPQGGRVQVRGCRGKSRSCSGLH